MQRIAITVVAVWFLALGGCGKKESQLVSGDSAVLVGTLERNVHGYELKLIEGKHFSGEDICDEGMRQSVWLSGEQKIFDRYVGKTVEVAGRLGCPRGGWVFAAEKVTGLPSKSGDQRKTIAYSEKIEGVWNCLDKQYSSHEQIHFFSDKTYISVGDGMDTKVAFFGEYSIEDAELRLIRRSEKYYPLKSYLVNAYPPNWAAPLLNKNGVTDVEVFRVTHVDDQSLHLQTLWAGNTETKAVLDTSKFSPKECVRSQATAVLAEIRRTVPQGFVEK